MITVTLGEVKPQEKPFPKLMISTEKSKVTGRIVFFKTIGRGTVISVGSVDTVVIGEYRINFDMDYFTDYNEPITIQNA